MMLCEGDCVEVRDGGENIQVYGTMRIGRKRQGGEMGVGLRDGDGRNRQEERQVGEQAGMR